MLEVFKAALLEIPEIDEISCCPTADALEPLLGNLPQTRLLLCHFLSAFTGEAEFRPFKAKFGGAVNLIALLPAIPPAKVINKLISSGADGILSMDSSLQDFKDAIMLVGNGEKYVGNELQALMLGEMFNDGPKDQHLTAREQQVLVKICSGRTIKEIAYDLNLSAHTVRHYHRIVMEKFDVNRTADLIVHAMKHGLYLE